MKIIFLCILLISCWHAFSQSPYGTGLIQGSITITINETQEEYCDGILQKKEVSKEQYSTDLTGEVYLTKDNIAFIRKYPNPLNLRGTQLALNNFTQTLPEGAVLWKSHEYDVPRFPLTASFEKKVYGQDPCRNNQECDPGFEPVLIYKENCEGIASHHGHPGAIFNIKVFGTETSGKYFFLSFEMGDFSWIENGTVDDVHIPGESSRLDYKITDNGCEWEWKKGEARKVMYSASRPEQLSVNKADLGDGTWYGTDGVYKSYEKTSEEESPDEIEQEMVLMRIDTADFFRYVLERPSAQTFSMSGSSSYTLKNERFRKVRNQTITATLTIGKKSSFTLVAENEEEYKNWLPGHPDYAGTSKPLAIKAKFEEGQQQDTILFSIDLATHLPGICTNFPILPDNPPKEPIDIYFAPQDQQTDPSIKIVNDSTAITTKKAREATIMVMSRDFGAHAHISAMASRTGELAECPYDTKQSLTLPYDLNDNAIADKWEKDIGIEGADKLEDIDKLPSGQGREGDGLTVFEEYRGFICEKDLEASCDGGHTQRTGKHVRTSPLGRDVFIFDADGLFAKYVAPANPAECHWHYVNREQMKIPPQDEVTPVVKALENDYPPVSEQSEAAKAIRAELDAAGEITKKWTDKEYRRINSNTPDKFRSNLQFGMHLIVSPLTSTIGGMSIYSDSRSKISPLRYTPLVVLPQYGVLKTRMMGIMSMLMLNSSHPTLWDKYPVEVQEKVVQTAYEAMVPHEVGHGLGILHHTKGNLTVITSDTKEKFVITGSNVGSVDIPESKGECQEVFYFDGQEYLITSFQSAFIAMGVTECCMRYTVEREVDFVEMKVLTPSVKYCRKGQTFTDGNGNKTDSDDCFSKILVRCID